MLLCQLCPRWRGFSELLHRHHIRFHGHTQCGLCRRPFAHAHRRLLHKRLGRCPATRSSRDAALRARLARGQAEGGQLSRTRSSKAAKEDSEAGRSGQLELPRAPTSCARCGQVGQHHGASSKQCGKQAFGFACDGCGSKMSLMASLQRHWSKRSCMEQTQRNARLDKTPQTTSKTDESGTVICPKCKDEFLSPNSLKAHLQYSGSCGKFAGRFSCDGCGRKFPLESALLSHLKRKRCEERKELATWLSNIDRASKERDENGLITCISCEMKFNTVAKLKVHMSFASSCGKFASRYECDNCNRKFGMISKIGAHLAEQKCQKRKKLDEWLSKVAETSSSPNDYGIRSCLNCKRKYCTQLKLKKHLAFSKTCGKNVGRYTCDKCGYKFVFELRLLKHLEKKLCDVRIGWAKRKEKLVAAAANNFACLRCGLTMGSELSLKNHLILSSSCGDMACRFTCDGCSQYFATAARLAQHTAKSNCADRLRLARRRSRMRGGACGQCGREFRCHGTLYRHLSTSRSCGDEQRRFRCDDCTYASPMAAEIRQHLSLGCPAKRFRERQRNLKQRALRCSECGYVTHVPACFRGHEKRRPNSCRMYLRANRKKGSVVCSDVPADSQQAVGGRTLRRTHFCSGCGFSSKSFRAFLNHKTKTENCRLYEASQRNQRISDSLLKEGRIVPLESEAEKMYMCIACGYTKDRLYKVIDHVAKPKSCSRFWERREKERLKS